MKKQNPIILAIMLLTLIAFQSCDDKLGNNASNDPIAEPLKEIAIEISQEKENYQFIESVFEAGNEEFSQGVYIQSIPHKIRNMRIAASEAGDTIKSADEIPVYFSEEINQKIYMDGTYRYLNLNTTPADSNAFNDLNVHKQPLEEIAVKTIINDGIMYVYNRNGSIIHTADAGKENYTGMLDSIRNAMASEDKSESSPQGVKALQARRLTKALKSAQSSGMRMLSQTSDEIMMEMDLGVSSESSLPQRVKTSVQRKAIMRFSGDMTRMLDQKIYENKQLIILVSYEYVNDNDQQFAKKAPSAVQTYLPNTSVKSLTFRALELKSNGTPFVSVTKENYKKNKVTINL